MTTIPLKLNGYTDLPPGKIANVTTYFEMRRADFGGPSARAPDVTVRPPPEPSIAWFRTIMRKIGDPWLWTSVALLTDEEITRLIDDPLVDLLVAERDGAEIGAAEINRRQPGEAEVVLFGVLPSATGTGAGRALMDGVLTTTFDAGVDRIWLHTCTHDHPAAVRFYQKCGFTPFKFAIEVMDDPRLSGVLPEHSAPHLALIKR